MTSLLYDGESFDDLLPSDPYVSVPAELKQNRLWLVYRMEPGAGGKKNKIPYDPTTGKKANNPDLGVTYDIARAAEKNFSGLGFYVESPYTVIDVDNCIDPKTGLVAEYAAKIVREVNSYAEASPSGTGIHIWVRGTKPGDKCRKGIEIYSTKRFLTVTGFHVPGTPSEIFERDITDLYNNMLAGDYQSPEIKSATVPSISTPKMSAEIKSSGKVITTKLQLFMAGEIISTKPFVVADEYENKIQFPSQSEADLSLATLLAFKYDGDAGKIDGDFRASSLYRAKWDRQDYRDGTIKQAVSFFLKSKALATPPTQAPQILVEENEEEVVALVDDKLPAFPTFTGSLADLCNAMSPDIPYPFKFSTGLTHLGLIRSGVDTLEVEPHIQPRFYTALIAGPGRGKTAAINEIGKIMKTLTSQYHAFSSIDSGPALVDAFQEQIQKNMMKVDPQENLSDSLVAKILLSPDELKGIFEKAKITTSSRNSMLDELLKLYEGNTTGNRVRGMKIKIHIENAHLGLIGGATESGYTSMWTGTGGASDGLQSRIIPIGIEDRKMPSVQRPADAEALTVAIQRLVEQVKQPGVRFEFDDDAFEMYDAWWRAKDQAKASETRIDGIVKRLLIVLARTNDASVINADLMQQAVDFGDFVIACRDKYNPLDASTWCQAFENLIITAYQRHGDLTANNCRRLVRPERRPGGAGPFLQAFRNLVQTGILRELASTQRAKVYHLSL